MSGDVIVAIHAAATWAMVGLIWFVQLVHYPLFSAVGAPEFVAYEAQHTRRTTWVVAMFMPVELATAAWIVVGDAGDVPAGLAWLGLATVIALWTITLTVQVPQHRRLGQEFDAGTARRLVAGNWVRTALWSLRGVVALMMLTA